MLRERIKLGIAPIGWTNDDLPELGGEIPFEQCVSEMALCGYEGCEVGNKYPRDVKVLRKALELRGLQICNQWFTYKLTEEPLEKVQEHFSQHLDFLQAMGADIVGGGECGHAIQGTPVAILDTQVSFSEAQWKMLIDGLHVLGEMAKNRGITLSFHHHMGTGIESRIALDRLMVETDPQLVSLNYDCGHLTFAGEDPVEALDAHIDRVAHVHVKDVRPKVLQQVKEQNMSFLAAVKAGVFTVPGDPEGSIDFPAIFKILDQANYKGWIVVEAEQDPYKANPLAYSMMGKKYIEYQLSVLG